MRKQFYTPSGDAIEFDNLHEWTPTRWDGNRDLEIESHTKIFANPHNNNYRVPVTIFQYAGKWSYVVSAGAYSDASYTGYCPGCDTLELAKDYVERITLFR